MRDLKRPNALHPAYKQLAEARIEVFTPMKWLLKTKHGRRIREQVPVIPDLLFVCETRSVLDPIVDKTSVSKRGCLSGTDGRAGCRHGAVHPGDRGFGRPEIFSSGGIDAGHVRSVRAYRRGTFGWIRRAAAFRARL